MEIQRGKAVEFAKLDAGEFFRAEDEARKPSLPVAVTVVTAKPGFTCKFNGRDCAITGVSADGMSADLRLAATGVELRTVPVAELRYVVDPDAAEVL